MKSKRYRFFALIIVGIILSSLYACSLPAYDIDIIEKIGLNNNIFYVRASKDCNYCENVLDPIYFSSDDNGQTWKEIASPTSEMVQILDGDQNKQFPLCLSVDLQICYQITNKEQVEISTDGGITWRTDWQIPFGRKYYMQRHANYYPAPDTIPYDIQIIESSNEHFVIVAMGNQGVLVKSANGEWDRYKVGKAVPTPYQASSFSDATDVLFNECIAAILIAIGFFLILSMCAWLSMYIRSNAILRKKVLLACLPFGTSVVFYMLYYFASFSSISSELLRIPYFYEVQTFVAFLPLIGFIITWLAIIIISRAKRFSFLALLIGISFSIISYLGVFFPFQLWALGAIQVYETAQVVVWVVGIMTLLIGVVTEIKIAAQAVKQTSG